MTDKDFRIFVATIFSLVCVILALAVLFGMRDDAKTREIPEGCMIVDFNGGKSSDVRMVCRNESHPVPEAR